MDTLNYARLIQRILSVISLSKEYFSNIVCNRYLRQAPKQGTSNKESFLYAFIGTLILFFRNDNLVFQRIWAEDGTFFYAQLLSKSNLEYLFSPIAGYLFFLQRLMFLPAQFLNFAELPIFIFALCSINYLVCIYIISRVFRSKPRFENLALSLAITIIPIASSEAIFNLANIHWYWLITWVVVVVYSQDFDPKLQKLFNFLTAILILSNPVFGVFAFLVVILGLTPRIRLSDLKHDWIFASSYLLIFVTTIVQTTFALRNRVGFVGFENIYQLIGDFFLRVQGVSALGYFYFRGINTLLGVAIFGITFLFLLIVYSMAKDSRIYSFSLFLLTPPLLGVLVDRTQFESQLFLNSQMNSRYFVTSGFLCVFLAIKSLFAVVSPSYLFLRKFFVFSYLLFAVLSSWNLNSLNQELETSKTKFLNECRSDLDGKVRIEISPPGWSMKIPCGR